MFIRYDNYSTRGVCVSGSDGEKYKFVIIVFIFKFVTVILFVAISQNFTKVVFELCAKVC